MNSLHHHRHSHCHHTLLTRLPTSDTSHPPSSIAPSLFLKPFPSSATTATTTTTTSLSSSTTTFSLSSTTPSSSTTSTSQPISFDLLHQHLSTQNFRQADEETRRLLIVLAGEAAQKRGYVFFSEVQFISETDLKAIDDLWKKYSDNKFGYSVQRKLWKNANKDFTRFFLKVGWMKKLDTEVEQYNYRSFPNEFMWELTEDTPEGHLPLTNALRGTQLLNSILSHPAFDEVEEEEGGGGEEGKGEELRDGERPLSNKLLKPDYSF
ncbi:hypothetical protein SLEP1_g29015 [Rubroshorea leprosula]|uniref:GUN4-like domain-containing protein n=1 Tax=Rubroshorea leprosula TaxID=152421 RepID=A0AAV5JVI9_9ROSI|nr:hypothetical protein SLEP1_g29015 [Rubroshorea leprosula]